MRYLLVIFIAFSFVACNGVNKVLKSKDPEYKLRMAEQYYAKKKFLYAQQLYEDVIPFFKGRPEFEDIYYKYAFTAYNQQDFLNAENLFKTYLEAFPTSARSEEIEYMRAYTFYKQSAKAELDQSNTLKAMGMMQTFINTHPTSAKAKEATDIIDALRLRLEKKDFNAAQLYFDLGQFRAAAVSFNSLLNAYPDTQKADEYKLMSIKSYFRLAENSVEEKRMERFEKVIEECNDFIDRFPESPLRSEVDQLITSSKNNIKNVSNESVKTPA
ncbi:outer membrane protein assembly factor BamD [Pseudocnuella soli]|uniref:outer membrane protein assembly factor BamD n=1 Tax=Pseudocnuella soli TaxID=2502779 RepID=UPI0010448F5E|nr:outer membrane protein assembly factor BamD [Pseudocnuella soli]